MNDKNHFFKLLDEYNKKGYLPDGKKIGRSRVKDYFNQNNYEFYDHLGKRVTDFTKWYQNWYHSRAEVNIPRLDKIVNDLHLHEKIKNRLNRRKEVTSIEQLSNEFDVGVGKIKHAIEQLQSLGHTVELKGGQVMINSDIPKSEETKLNISKLSTGVYKFGLLGDNHLCSRYERLDVLNALYDYYKEQGITIVYNTGNWIDGEAKFNKHDLHTHGMDNQIRYFLDTYPKRDGIQTRYITGDDHEGWYTQREGINVGKYTQILSEEHGRKDLFFLGHMEHDEIIKTKKGQTRVRILHPGGGSSYATSYSVQKIVESYTGGDKPDVLFVGHYHKSEYTYYRGVHIVQSGTTEDQTPFMRKKKLSAHLGGWVIEFSNDDKGAITKFKCEFIPFYDKEYYKTGWEYKW
jgi:predicted phosphodiesterase